MGISFEDIQNMCDGIDKEFLSRAMALTIFKLGENGVLIEFIPNLVFGRPILKGTLMNESEFNIDFSKHDEQLRLEWLKDKEEFSNIFSRMTPKARKAIESGELLGTQFITCAELGKIKAENKELKSQCECLKEEVEKLNCEIQRLREKCGEVPTKEDTTPKRKFNIGDVVLCHKFSIEGRLVISGNGFHDERYLDTSYFNRKAFISNTYKCYMEQHGEENTEDKDEYEITFLDNGNSLAWVSGEELTLLMKY